MTFSRLLVVWGLLGPFILSAQDSSRITACAQFWKTAEPMPVTAIGLKIEAPNLPVNYILADDDQGCHEFVIYSGVYPPDTKFDFFAIKGDVPENGLSIVDMNMMSRHVLGLSTLPTVFQIIAADANVSSGITTFDAVNVRRILLGDTAFILPFFQWRFLPNYVTFPNPNDPFSLPPGYDSRLNMSQLQALHNGTVILRGIKIGDVDGDAALNGFSAGPTCEDTIQLQLPAVDLVAGQQTVLPLQFKNPLSLRSLQLALTYDPQKIRVDSIVGIAALASSGWSVFGNRFADGRFHVVATSSSVSAPNGTTLNGAFAQLYVTPLQNAAFSNAFQVATTAPMKSFGLQSTNSITKIRCVAAQIFYPAPVGTSDAPIALSASTPRPNPFDNQSVIEINLRQSEQVRTEVFDLNGRLLWTAAERRGAGLQAVTIPAAALPPGRMGIYRITAGNATVAGKINRQ